MTLGECPLSNFCSRGTLGFGVSEGQYRDCLGSEASLDKRALLERQPRVVKGDAVGDTHAQACIPLSVASAPSERSDQCASPLCHALLPALRS